MKWIEAVKPKSISKTTWKVTDLRSLQSIKGDEVVCSTWITLTQTKSRGITDHSIAHRG